MDFARLSLAVASGARRDSLAAAAAELDGAAAEPVRS